MTIARGTITQGQCRSQPDSLYAGPEGQSRLLAEVRQAGYAYVPAGVRGAPARTGEAGRRGEYLRALHAFVVYSARRERRLPLIGIAAARARRPGGAARKARGEVAPPAAQRGAGTAAAGEFDHFAPPAHLARVTGDPAAKGTGADEH